MVSVIVAIEKSPISFRNDTASDIHVTLLEGFDLRREDIKNPMWDVRSAAGPKIGISRVRVEGGDDLRRRSAPVPNLLCSRNR